jgi:hypothetical protein
MRHEFARSIDEKAAARNMALMMKTNRFAVLKEHLPDLLEDASGRSLVRSLNEERYGALHLYRTNGSIRFHADLRKHAADYLGIHSPQPEALPFEGTVARRLNKLLADFSSSTPRIQLDPSPKFSAGLVGGRQHITSHASPLSGE